MAKKKGAIADLLSLHTNPLKIHPDGTMEFDLSNAADAAFAEKHLSQAREQAAALYKQGATLQEAMVATRQASASLPSIHIAPTAGATLKEALEQHYSEETRRGHVAKTMSEKKSVFADFLGFFGDIPLNDITLERIGMRDGWRDTEYKRPNDKYPDKKRAGNTLEKRRGYLSKFFDWARQAGKYQRDNPVSQQMATKAEMNDQRTPWAEFDDGDIKALFCADYPQKMDKPDFYWLPLMALFSGARLGELARLELSTFREVDGVKCYRIQDGKTLESRRTVPIHSQLLALGLWDYTQALSAKGETFLIPHRPQDPAGTPKRERKNHPEKMAGRQWGLWVEKCGLTDKTKVFHSFRSTAITDLRNTEANPAAIKRSVGHTTPDMGGAHAGYVRGIALKNLQKAVEHLTHQQVNFEALKLADPTFTAFFAKENSKVSEPKTKIIDERKARHLKAKAEREERNRDKRKKIV